VYNLAVIGGGPGGYVAAIRGAQKGLKVLLIEKDSLGGTCLNRGCIPTKSFVYDSRLLYQAKNSPVLLGGKGLNINATKMLARKNKVVQTMRSGLKQLLNSNQIDIIEGEGLLDKPGTVSVRSQNGSTEDYQVDNTIIATGSRPTVPSFISVDGNLVQTTDEALNMNQIPKQIVIIGGGVIGVEMASVYLNLGTEVTILELLPDLLITEDQEVRQTMRQILVKRGANILLKTTVKTIDTKKGSVHVTYVSETGQESKLTTDKVLVATGRTPVLEGISTKELGLHMNGSFIQVDSQMQTNLPGIYAIGDVVGGMMLAHKASAEAEVAVENILGNNKRFKPELIPRCVWGATEIGAVGITEEEALSRGRSIRIGKFNFTGSGAAQAMGHSEGFTKIIGDGETGEILGIHIIGEHATDLIGDAVTAMTMESVVEDLAVAVKPHPTLSETIMEAAMNWSGTPIHTILKK
jgi:dihydrolipoamide dehydrogenase